MSGHYLRTPGRDSMVSFVAIMLPHSSSKQLLPVYLVAGDEPLLLRDWLDQARGTLKNQGFEEILSHQADKGFDWDALAEDGQSMSLFSSKRCLIVRFNSSRPGQPGARFITQSCENPSQDIVLILVMPKLDASAKSSAWLRKIKQCGAVIEIQPVYPDKRVDWILERALAKGLNVDRQAAGMLGQLTEGNLLATDQELEKLALTVPGEALIGIEEITQSIEQSARFTQYVLVDACLEGRPKRAERILRGLRQEGLQPAQFVYALQQALETLLQLKLAQRQQRLGADVWKSLRIWQAKQRLYSQALGRLELSVIERLLVDCAKLDRLNKGRQQQSFEGDDWLALHQLVSDLAGLKITEYQTA